MPKQKSRTHKVSPNTAGTQRRIEQEDRAAKNKKTVTYGGQTPWQIACNKRLMRRICDGKPLAWNKKQAYNAKKLAAVK